MSNTYFSYEYKNTSQQNEIIFIYYFCNVYECCLIELEPNQSYISEHADFIALKLDNREALKIENGMLSVEGYEICKFGHYREKPIKRKFITTVFGYKE